MDHKDLESLKRKREKASQILREKIYDLSPGKALELGCSTGDDSLWLAEVKDYLIFVRRK